MRARERGGKLSVKKQVMKNGGEVGCWWNFKKQFCEVEKKFSVCVRV